MDGRFQLFSARVKSRIVDKRKGERNRWIIKNSRVKYGEGVKRCFDFLDGNDDRGDGFVGWGRKLSTGRTADVLIMKGDHENPEG